MAFSKETAIFAPMIGERILNYQIESLLGEGGVGKVYLAVHTQLGRKVAIKALNAGLVGNQEVRERFRQEASTLSSLQHLNIITLYDYVENEQGLFLIMEYAQGNPLDDYIKKVSGPIPENKTIYFFNQILDGLQYAHAKSIVHRDIKPSNVFITQEGNAKILDFGIAKILKEGGMNMTKDGARLGTVLYMSPEQVKGQQVDSRSDIYALGVTLFEMLTGRCPYNEHTLSEYDVYQKIVNEPLPRLRDFYPAISERMQNIIDKATAKDPSQRFQSCDEFRQALNGASFMVAPKHSLHASPIITNTTNNPQVSPLQQTTLPTPEPENQYRKPEKKERRNSSNTFLYVIMAGILAVSFVFLYIQFLSENKPTLSENTDNTAEKNKKAVLDDENEEKVKKKEEKPKEKSEEEKMLDTLKAKQEKIEDLRKLILKDREAELLKALRIDDQFESNDLGEYTLRVTVANTRDDVAFKDIVIGITYFNAEDKELRTIEKELKDLKNKGKVPFTVKENISAEKHKVFRKSAKPIDMETPESVDSLNTELKKIKEKMEDLQERLKEEKDKNKKE